MGLRRALARALVRRLLRPGLAPGLPLAVRRARTDRTGRLLPLPRGVVRRPSDSGGPRGEWWAPRGVEPDKAPSAILYLHGGGFILGSPASHRAVAARLAALTRLPVFVLDYRRPPEPPFPAALDDAAAGWQWLTHAGRPAGVAGDSAGGWLALALALRAAEAGLARPAGMALFSPLVELAVPEHARPAAGELLLPPGFLSEGVGAFRGRLPADHASLGWSRAAMAALPPLFVSFDRDELLAGDARGLIEAARAGGVAVETEETTGLWHAWPLFTGLLPEASATLQRAAAVLRPSQTRPA